MRAWCGCAPGGTITGNCGTAPAAGQAVFGPDGAIEVFIGDQTTQGAVFISASSLLDSLDFKGLMGGILCGIVEQIEEAIVTWNCNGVSGSLYVEATSASLSMTYTSNTVACAGDLEVGGPRVSLGPAGMVTQVGTVENGDLLACMGMVVFDYALGGATVLGVDVGVSQCDSSNPPCATLTLAGVTNCHASTLIPGCCTPLYAVQPSATPIACIVTRDVNIDFDNDGTRDYWVPLTLVDIC